MWFIADLNTIQTWIQLESEFKSEHWKWLGSQRMRAKRSAKKKKLRSIVQSSRENCQFFTKSPLFHFHTFLYIFFAHYNSNQVKSSEISIFISFFRVKFRSTEIHLQKKSLKIFRFFFLKIKNLLWREKKNSFDLKRSWSWLRETDWRLGIFVGVQLNRNVVCHAWRCIGNEDKMIFECVFTVFDGINGDNINGIGDDELNYMLI